MHRLTKIKQMTSHILSKPITMIPLVIICCLVSLAAGRVNGLFNNVDALGGYTLNGTSWNVRLRALYFDRREVR